MASILNVFTGGMNMDINPSMIKEGDYVYAENVRIGFSESNNMGCVENVKSTLEIANSDLIDKTGRYKEIGSASYESKSLLFYFVKDYVGTNDAIYEFNLVTRNISTVLKGEILDFGGKIKSAVYFNGFLYWTDGESEPRCIDVEKAKSGKYITSTKDYTNLIKVQPDATIIPELFEDALIPISSFEDKNYRFIYRYIFAGNQVGAWSMPSRMIAYGYDTTKKKMRLNMKSSEILFASFYQGLIDYVEIGMRDEDSQPFKFIKRLAFPTANNASFYYDFDNSSIYSVISTLETNRYYDDVPRTSQSMTLIDSRLMLANNKTGFNNIPLISALNFAVSYFPPDANTCNFKSGGSYGIGVQMYDRFMRRTFTYPLGGFTAKERNGAFSATQIDFALSCGAGLPEWCEYWAIAMTKCNNKGSFQQVHVTIVGTPTVDKITFSPTFITPTNSAISWVYSDGDRCSIRTLNTGGSVVGGDFYNLPLKQDSNGDFYIEKSTLNLPSTISNGAIMELFTPLKSTESPFYYEVGEINPVQLDANGVKRFGNDSFGVAKLVTIKGGDTQYRSVDNCESMSPTEKFYENWSHNIGRPNSISQNIEEESNDISTIAYSDPFIQGTKLNGLNTFQFLSKKTYPIELGAITKIIVARDYEVNGSVMLIVTEFNCYSVYIGKTQIKNPDGTSQLVVNESILGTYNLLAGGFGSIHPESVHAFGTTVRGYDMLKGVIWRYSTDGLTAISQQYGTNSYTSKRSDDIFANKDNVLQNCPAGFDPFFDEYVLCIKDINAVTNKCIAFNEDRNKFSTFYDMNPDGLATLNRYLISFKNGALYLHRAGGGYNTLQDKKVSSIVSFASKTSPFDTINGTSIRVYAQDEWTVNVDGCARSIKARQSSKTIKGEFGEDSYLYPIKSDVTSGNPLKSRHFVVTLAIDNIDYATVLYGAQTIVSQSSPKANV